MYHTFWEIPYICYLKSAYSTITIKERVLLYPFIDAVTEAQKGRYLTLDHTAGMEKLGFEPSALWLQNKCS